MRISSLSVRRGVTFGMVYLIVLGFGLFSLSRLNLDLWPDISFPSVIVITNYTGASPEDMETLVTSPLEGALASVKDVEEINSSSKQGISLITVEVDWGKDMEQAETDVRRSLEMIKGFLPEDAEDPVVFAFDPSLQPIILMMVSGPYPLDVLRDIAEDDVKPHLERLNGIASTEVAGGLEREIHVVVDPVRLGALGLDVNQVVSAVYRENTQVPGGSIEQGTLDFTIQTKGKYQSVDEIGEVLVGAKQGPLGPEPIRLKEVAQVKDAFYESQRILEVDDLPSVWVLVRKQSGANTVRAAQAVVEALPIIKRESAAEIEFNILFSQADIINLSLGNLSSTGLIGVLITLVVLLFFLRNLRSALIVSTAIPLSVVTTFFVMDQADMTLNILSMAGLALSIGMLVDNAIVVLENIFRLRQGGLSAWEAAIQGAGTVGTAVTASTLTTIAVFIPILFVPGIAGVMFNDMAVTICFALVVSLMVALTFIPLAASRLLGTSRAEDLLEKARRRDPLRGIRERYAEILGWILGHRWVVGVSLLGLLAVTVLISMALPTEFIAQDDQSHVFLTVETPIGNNLQETYSIVKEVVARVDEVVRREERKLVADRPDGSGTGIALDVGVGKGFVSIFAKGVHAGVIRVPLVNMGQRERSQQEIEDALREEFQKIPGVKVTVGFPFNPVGGEGDIEIQIRGHDLEVSRRVGLELQEKLSSMPEIASARFSMQDQKPEVRVSFQRQKMAQLGISSAAVSNAVSACFMGRTAGRFAEGGDEYEILVRYPKKHRQDIDELSRMPVAVPSGATVPLDSIADIEMGLGPVDITRLDQARVTRLICDLNETYTSSDGESRKKDLGASIRNVERVLKDHAWPKEYSYHIGGTAEDFMISLKYLFLALAVSVLMVYMVMASQFESLRQPFIIIFAVPLAGIGVVLMFTLTGSNLDVSAMVGVIMLVGIVVNNGIVMVDAANQLRRQGLDRREAIARASVMRMRPVLMTSLTTISAMAPLALEIGEGSAGWGAMAKAVIGGLLAATLLTLIVVPTMYTLFERKTIKQAKGADLVPGG